jgi:hypothetical protein
MGFRHTIISESFPGNLPEWFKNKWKHYVNFQENSLLVASVDERKFYTDEFFKDYQKAVRESGFWDGWRYSINVICLAEDGVATRVLISNYSIEYYILEDAYQSDAIWSG